MRPLPERPNLDQLKRQAKELARAADSRRPSALRRVRTVSTRSGLATAQLVLAREYGFRNWPALKAEVERRAKRPRLPKTRTWQEMRDWMGGLLVKRTGHDVVFWKSKMARKRFLDEVALRRWLREQGVTGYGQMLLVWERFGYPSFITAGLDDLIEGQYADRRHLRPIFDAVVGALADIGPITVQARKGYVSLVTERRTFAVVQATTRKRVDLGLRLAGVTPAERLESAKGVGNGSMTVKLPLSSPADLDADARRWLKRAYDENA
jgi:hypothetical protein